MSDPSNAIPGLDAVARILPQDAQDKILGDAGDVAAVARQALDSVKGEAGQQFDIIKQQAQDQLADVTGKAKTFAGEQKDAAGEQLDSVATAISKVADELNDQPVVAGYAHELADGIKRVSETVKSRNVDELLAMAEDFGRTQPVAFIGAAALAGFVASRFVLSSAGRRNNPSPASPASASKPVPAAYAPPRQQGGF